MKIRDVMSHKVTTVAVDDGLELARQTMLWGGFRHLPVLDRGKLAGILSERDILRAKSSAAAKDRLPMAGEVMQVPAESAGPEEEVEPVANRMASMRVSCMPVVENGNLVGIVTATDLLAQLGECGWVREASRLPAVSAVMSTNPPVTSREDHLSDAAKLMAKHHIRHLPVVDENGKLEGILSDRDILRHGSILHRSQPGGGRHLGPQTPWQDSKVGDAMTPHPHTIALDASIAEAMSIFVDRRFGALLVVDHDGRLRGILSYVDILAHLGGGARVGTQASLPNAARH